MSSCAQRTRTQNEGGIVREQPVRTNGNLERRRSKVGPTDLDRHPQVESPRSFPFRGEASSTVQIVDQDLSAIRSQHDECVSNEDMGARIPRKSGAPVHGERSAGCAVDPVELDRHFDPVR
jgi:hypothetical protein